MEKPFQKDLSHLSWNEVYERQTLRADLVSDWMEALRLKPGDRVLEIGAGPGYVSFVLAERVGHTGTINALDRSADFAGALVPVGRALSPWTSAAPTKSTLEIVGC